MMCHRNIDGPAAPYGCAPCEFYIHNLRRELPQEIRHPFHPRHCLTLVDIDNDGDDDEEEEEEMGESSDCSACCFHVDGFRYRCDECKTNLHPECTSLKPNIKYTCHDHLLILVENLSYETECEACGFDIQGVFFMRCLECCLDFHMQCDSDHQLLPTVWGKEHEHPVIYSTETIANKDDSYLHYFNVCGKELRKSEDPFYHCAICYEYVAHVRCAITEVQYDGKGKLRHFSHEHILALREISKNDGTLCYGCGKAVQGSAHCSDSCQFYLHKSCVELSRQIWGHHSHKQYLTLQRIDISAKKVCRTCKKRFSSGFIYHYDTSQYNMCLDCASTHPLIKKDYHEDQQRITHFSHEHYLVNLEAAEVNCKLCLKNINDQCHGCAQCEFYIHNSCASLVQGIRHPFHPRHSLTLLAIKKPRYVCNACGFHVPDLRYCCEGSH